MPPPQIEIEDDPTPFVMAVATELRRRLADPGFADLTSSLAGTAGLRYGSGPEAATIELEPGRIAIRHGAGEARVIASLDPRGRWDGEAIAGEDERADLAAWLRELARPPERPWREAARAFWAELESSPGAPRALRVVDLESGEEERFGGEGRAYEIHGRPSDLVALLEGRSSLLEEAFERRVYIRGSFAEISVLSGAAFRVRTAGGRADA